jgi:hypothetical protein
LGSDYGIIFYNETPLKDRKKKWNHYYFTDFEAMGKILAEMILKGTKTNENKSALILSELL